jgi:2-methylcitrate dehydratase
MQGRGVDLSIFEPDEYLDPAARPLMAKVTVVPDADCDAVHPDGVMLKCDAVANDGRTESFAVSNPKGFWSNPMTAADVELKFHGLVEPRYGSEVTTELHDYWSAVSERTDLAAGLRLFVPSTTSSNRP